MKTELVTVCPKNIDETLMQRAGKLIAAGGLVAFPTETVYGLGGDALDAEAAKKIYAAKGRPSDNPLIVHIAEVSALWDLAREVPQEAEVLAEAFWPGPLTMILYKSDKVPDATTGGLHTVAVRMPDHGIALSLIRNSGCYIAAPSANASGRPSPTQAAHVLDDLDGRIAMIVDGGEVGIGIESTIVDLTGPVPMILRPGYITQQMLSEVLQREVVMDPGIFAEDDTKRPKAPGMKYRHYAPKADMIVIDGKQERVVAEINRLAGEQRKEGRKAAVIAAEETAGLYTADMVFSAGTRSREETIAQRLYRILRECDDSGADVIYSESFETPGFGQAIMNRLLKAAGHQIRRV